MPRSGILPTNHFVSFSRKKKKKKKSHQNPDKVAPDEGSYVSQRVSKTLH